MYQIKLNKVLDLDFLKNFQQELIKARGPIKISSFSEDIFNAGADLNFLLKGSKSEIKDFFYTLANILNQLWNWEDLVVCDAKGKSVGGGVGFIMVSDICFASANFKWRFSEIGLGFGPYVISPFVSARIGYFNMLSLVSTGRWVDYNESMNFLNLAPSDLDLDAENYWFKLSKKMLKPKIEADFECLVQTVTELVVSERVRKKLSEFVSSNLKN